MSEKEKALVPVEQREVEFYGDEITAVQMVDGQVYIPIRPICRLLGLNWDGQRRRVLRDPVLADEVKGVVVTTTPGGSQEMTCLPLDIIAGFLFGINSNRVKPELKDKVIRYQKECYKVLDEAFREGRLTVDPSFDELLQTDSDAVQAYKMAAAIMKLARNQVLMEARLDDYGERLERVEAVLGDSARHITPDQATAVSQAVKAVALVMGKQTGKNEYGGVYNELYRRYRIPSYRELPAAKYEDAIQWLGEWLESLTGDEPF